MPSLNPVNNRRRTKNRRRTALRLLLWPSVLVPAALLSLFWGRSYGESVQLEAQDQLHQTQVRSARTSLALASADAGVVLYDRVGRLLGEITADGELLLAEGVAPEIVPRRVIESSLREQREALRQGHSLRSLRLSLDLELGQTALASFRWHRGSIVLLDPKTGEILAAVSDPRTFRLGGTPALEQFREPASIAKIITTTAYERAGLDADATLARSTCTGHGLYAGEKLYCPHIGGRLRGLDRALGISCNMAFADLGVEIGRRRLLDEYRRYGFGAENLGQAPWNFPAGRILVAEGNDRQLADLSIGLDDAELTPLHSALLAAVMANDGVMPTPTLFALGDLSGQEPARESLRGKRVIESEWIPEMLQAMVTVAERGTGRHIAPRNFPVAMKTGTASHPRYGFHVNYIGVGPMPDPQIAFGVRITDQPTSRKVRAAARVVTAKLLRDLARTRALHPDFPSAQVADASATSPRKSSRRSISSSSESPVVSKRR